MKIKYIPIFTDDLERQVNFFTENLGFEIHGKKNILPGQESILLKTNNPDVFMVVMKDTAYEFRKNRIVLNTDDCLNDYHALKKMIGIKFFNEPQYLPMGLGAEFSDPAGNRYLLIEERSYI